MERSPHNGTRDRLLIAAGEVFAESGYRAATVRGICRRAGVNAALVNYHFRSKRELYAAVLEFAYRQALRKYPHEAGDAARETPERRLARFVHNFMLRILDEGRPAWYGKLMSREMMEPTGALDRLVDRNFRPHHEYLRGIVREMLGPGGEDRKVTRCVFSILGQCLFYRHSRPVIARLYPSLRYDAEEIEEAASHVVAFALAGLRQIAGRPKAAAQEANSADCGFDTPGGRVRRARTAGRINTSQKERRGPVSQSGLR